MSPYMNTVAWLCLIKEWFYVEIFKHVELITFQPMEN